VDATYVGVIAGTGSFTLGATSTNTLTLTGANTYTGATTVSAGTLALVGGSHASPITVSAGASLGFTLGSPTTSTSTFNLTNGTIKITGTPTLPSYTLITDSAGITGTPTLHTPIAGYSLVKQGNSLVLITPQGLYDTWKNGTFANAFTLNLPGQDQDTDGFKNVMEYAFGTDPTVNSSAPLTYSGGTLTSTGQPILVKEGGVWYAVFGRRKDYVEAGLTYTVEFSNSLATWEDNVTVPEFVATDGTIDAVRVPFPNFIDGPSGPQKPTFFRVEVSSSF
jgi:autotransporter-associated beta strand protein